MHVLLAACHEQAGTRVDCILTLTSSVSFCCSRIALLTSATLIHTAAVSLACPHHEHHAQAKL